MFPGFRFAAFGLHWLAGLIPANSASAGYPTPPAPSIALVLDRWPGSGQPVVSYRRLDPLAFVVRDRRLNPLVFVRPRPA